MQTLCVQPVSPPRIAAHTVKLNRVLTNACDEAWTYIDPERYSQATGENRALTTANLTVYASTEAQQRAAS